MFGYTKCDMQRKNTYTLFIIAESPEEAKAIEGHGFKYITNQKYGGETHLIYCSRFNFPSAIRAKKSFKAIFDAPFRGLYEPHKRAYKVVEE